MSNNNSNNKYQNIIDFKEYEKNKKEINLNKLEKNPFERGNSNNSISQEKYISHSNSSLSNDLNSHKSINKVEEKNENQKNLILNNDIRMEYKPLSIRENFNLYFQMNKNKEESKILTTSSSLIKDENYLKIINDIYKKRKTNYNKEKENNDNLLIFDNNKLYEIQKNYMKGRDEKLLKLKNNILNKENLNCTFTPKILNENKNKKIDKNAIKQFFKRNIDWKNNINNENKNKLKEKLTEEKKIYTFYPKTNKEVHSKVLKSITENKNKTDYIYQNNINWLNKKNELIKEEEKKNNSTKIKKNNINKYKTKKNNNKIIVDLKNFKTEKNNQKVNEKNNNLNKNVIINNDIISLKDMINELKQTINLNKKFIKEITIENK
jgi:hypothetical protein